MKILWVKAGGLVPPDTGGKIRSYNILRELARQHAVTFFSFYAADNHDQHKDLNSIFEHVVCLPLELPIAKSSAEILNYGMHLLSPQPYGITKFCLPEVRRQVRALIDHEKYDVIVCDFMAAAGAIPWSSPVPKVLFTHNVEATIWRRHYEVAANPAWKAVSWLEWKKMESAERRYLRLANHVLTVSEADRNVFAGIIDPARLTVIPTGVDIEYFQPLAVREEPNSIVFTGSMDWLPNEDAMVYFLDEIFPLVRKQCPDATLEIVGRKPSRKLQGRAERDKDVTLTGWVEDIRPHLARGSVCIVPLRIGGGTRLKIFEAMSMAKPVVSTSIGAEGLPVESGENIFLADTAQDFAGRVVSLLRNSTERTRIGSAARRLVQEKYGWPRIAQIFARTLQDVLSRAQE